MTLIIAKQRFSVVLKVLTALIAADYYFIEGSKKEPLPIIIILHIWTDEFYIIG